MRTLRGYLKGIAALLALAILVYTGTNPVQAQVTLIGGGASGAAVGGTNVWTGSNTFTDSLFFLADDGDGSKKAQFQLSGITTATTRTFTLPNVDTTLAGLASSNVFTTTNEWSGNGQIFLGGSGSFTTGNLFFYDTTLTPDAAYIGVSSTGESLTLGEYSDSTFDFNNGPCGTATCLDPNFIIRSHNQTVGEYAAYRAAGTQTELSKTLTESSATAVVQVGIASGSFTGGSIEYTVVASDGTDHQSRHGRTIFQGVNKAGTETCTIIPVLETTDGSTLAASAGTLTYTWAADTAPTNACNFTLNAVSSLTQTVLRVYYTVVVDGPGSVVPQ